MSSVDNRESEARRKRRASDLRRSTVTTLLPVPEKRPSSTVALYPSEVFTTDYNQRLPEWRWRANNSETQEHWKNLKEFQMAAIGSVLGLCNIVYFPYYAAVYGNGVFMLAYVVVDFLIGFPILFLQMAVGQFTSEDTITVFTRLRLAQGVGISCALLTVLSLVQSSVKLSWILFLVFSSFNIQFSPFHWDMPWRNCEWTPEEIAHIKQCTIYIPEVFDANPLASCPYKYFHDVVLGLKGEDVSHGIYHAFHWRLIGCLFIFFLVVYAFLSRGIKSIGRAAVVLVPLACIGLVIFLLAQVIENQPPDRVWKALGKFFTPNWELLYDTMVTRLVLYSLNLDRGTMIVIGSYARFQSATHYHAFYVCLADVCLNLLSGVTLYIAWDELHYKCGIDVNHATLPMDLVTESEFFFIITSALDGMNLFSPVWMFSFFFMVFTLGVMRDVAAYLLIFKPIYTKFPNLKKHQHFYNFVILSVFFALALPFLTLGQSVAWGFIKPLMYPPTQFVPHFLVFFCVSAFVYLYGLKRLRQDIEFMLQFNPNIFFVVTWTLVPVIMLVIICAGLFVRGRKDIYHVSGWSIWVVFVILMLPIPAMGVYNVIRFYRAGELHKVFRPNEDMVGHVSRVAVPTTSKEVADDSLLRRHLARSVLPRHSNDNGKDTPPVTYSFTASNGSRRVTDGPMADDARGLTLSYTSLWSQRPMSDVVLESDASSRVTLKTDSTSAMTSKTNRSRTSLSVTSRQNITTASSSALTSREAETRTSRRNPSNTAATSVTSQRNRSVTSSSVTSKESSTRNTKNQR